MKRNSNSMLWISLSFIIAAVVLYFLDIKMNHNCSDNSFIPFNICSFVVLILLYGITLFLFTDELKIHQKNKDQLQNKLNTCKDSLNDVQSTLDEAVEKKTFEMAVINGSLNREIAERIQAEANGLKLRNRCHTILNSAGDGIFGIDTDGKVTFSNHKASEILGWTEEELIGSSHHDLVHHTYKNGAEFPVEECHIYMAYKDGQVHFEADDIFWTKEGKSFPVEYTSTPLIDGKEITGAVVVFKDISNAKKLEKQLDLIINSAGEGIVGLDIKGNVTFVNKAASIMLGWEQEELIGKSHHNLVHHSHPDGEKYDEKDCPIFLSCRDGQVHFKSDDVFWTKDGSSFAVEYNSTPIIEEKRLTGAVIVFRDLTTFS
jgi:PAS domain S-box-containing protein